MNVQIRRDRTISLRLAAGSSVRVLSGTAWLTQEGVLEDVVLRAGESFVVPHAGQQVISAVDGRAVIRVNDVHAEARALRSAEFRRIVQRVGDYFAGKIAAWKEAP